MKAKVKKGSQFLFTSGASNDWSDLKGVMIVNFNNKYTFLDFKQSKNHLLINTTEGEIDIVFTGETPRVLLENYCKDQLVFNLVKNNDERITTQSR